MPALLKAKSSRPKVSPVFSSAAFTSSVCVTSHLTASARPPSCSIRRAVSRLPCSATSPTTTLAPARAKAKAVARPIPLLPPVINATLPVKLPFSFVVAISDFAQLASHAHVHDKTILGLFRNDLRPSVVDSIHRYLCDLWFDLLESAKLQHVLSLADASCIGSSEGGSI